jgi:transposase, IS6 family
MKNASPFKWRHFEAEIILLCVRGYFALFPELSRPRGNDARAWLARGSYDYLSLSCSTMPRRLTNARGLISAACNDSWRVDETYLKVKKVCMYLYRAVDSEGNTLEFLLSSTRDAEAAKRFFLKALHSSAGSAPGAPPVEGQVEELTAATTPTTLALRVINIDKNAAYPKDMAELKASGVLPEAVEEISPGRSPSSPVCLEW